MRLPRFPIAGRSRFRLVYLWGALVAVGYLVFPPLPVCTFQKDRGVIATSADGNWMATIAMKLPSSETITLGEYFGPIEIWDLRRERLHVTLAENSRVRKVTFTPDGEYVIAGFEDKLYVWDTDNGTELLGLQAGELHSLVVPQTGPPLAVMLKAISAGRYAGDSYPGQVNLIEVPFGEHRTTIGPVQVAHDTDVFWGRDKATLRISANGSVAVTCSSPAKDGTLEFLVWELPSGDLLRRLPVVGYPLAWNLSPDGQELIHLTNVDPKHINEQGYPIASSPRRQINFWNLSSGTLQASISPDEDSTEAIVLAHGSNIDYAEYPTLMRVYTFAGICLLQKDKNRVTRLADGLTSAISADGSLVATKKGNVISIPFLGHVQTQAIAITRMPQLEEIRTINSPRDWPKDSIAFDPINISEDGKQLVYIDYTDNSWWATLRAYCGDLCNGSLLAGDSSGRTHSLRCLDISSGRTDIIFRTTRKTFGGRLLTNSRHFASGDSIWRVPGRSPWLFVLGCPTLAVAFLFSFRFIRRKRARTG